MRTESASVAGARIPPHLTFAALSPTFSSALITHLCGAVAQLGERLNGIQEVVGSTPIGSTKNFNHLDHLRICLLFAGATFGAT
jgi:hypothetical protein